MRPGASEIERFLIAYGDALTSGDHGALVTMFELPALALSDADSAQLSTDAHVVDSCTAASRRYESAGISSIRPEAVALEHLSDHLCSVDVRWLGLDARGAPTNHRELTSYVLRTSTEGTIRIQVAMVLPSRIPLEG